jgi:hypothetical protein
MKYPKLWNGPNPVGEAKVRQLQQVDAPFLGASGPGFTAGKMGALSEVKGGTDSPYLVVNQVFDEGGELVTKLYANNPRSRETRPIGEFSLGAGVGVTHAINGIHVGSGRVLRLAYAGLGYVPAEAGPHLVFPVLHNAIKNTPLVSDAVDPAERKKSSIKFTSSAVTFDPAHDNRWENYPDEIALGGITVFASGYDDEVSGYSFGWRYSRASVADTLYAPPGYPAHTNFYRYPYHFTANTADYEMAGSPSLAHPDAYNYRSPVFNAGPGKLAYMLVKKDFWPIDVNWTDHGPGGFSSVYSLAAQVPIQLAISEDHGRSWQAEDLTCLDDIIFAEASGYQGTASRPYRNDTLEGSIAYDSTVHYVGAGVNLLIAPGFGGTGGSRLAGVFLFRRSASGAYTRLSWPPDETAELLHFWKIQSWPMLSGHNFSFGEGCLVMVTRGPAKWTAPYDLTFKHRLLYTRDFGDTWNLSPDLPPEVTQTLQTVWPVITKPYKSPSQPGEILLTYPSNDAGATDPKRGTYAFKTDGNFESFERLGRVVPSKGNAPVALDISSGGLVYPFPQAGGSSAIYIGEHTGTGLKKYRPCINPAFPREFGK